MILRMGLAALSLLVLSCSSAQQDSTVEATLVSRPTSETRNDFYVSNREPLMPSVLIKLPVGSVAPRGWLLELLNSQRSGLTGHLGEISAWLQKADNAWLSKEGKGRWGWEELPYWL